MLLGPVLANSISVQHAQASERIPEIHYSFHQQLCAIKKGLIKVSPGTLLTHPHTRTTLFIAPVSIMQAIKQIFN